MVRLRARISDIWDIPRIVKLCAEYPFRGNCLTTLMSERQLGSQPGGQLERHAPGWSKAAQTPGKRRRLGHRIKGAQDEADQNHRQNDRGGCAHKPLSPAALKTAPDGSGGGVMTISQGEPSLETFAHQWSNFRPRG